MAEAAPATETLVSAQPEVGRHRLALVLKRSYRVAPDGRCRPDEEPVALEEGHPAYERVEPPRVSPPRWDSDLLAFKEATDIVLQGHAYRHGESTPLDAELRFGSTVRTVRVHGDRRCEWRGGGRLAFTPEEGFDAMPLRYDRAYGGFDEAALARIGDPVLEKMDRIEPRWRLMESTRFHYPRNPSGCGYVIEATREAVEGRAVPNLEFPWDPIGPERLVVGAPERWPTAPLPAGFDWYGPGWFPRLAYLGVVAEHEGEAAELPEVRQGWAPPSVLDQEPLQRRGWNPAFLQSAPPGLAAAGLRPDAAFGLRGLCPEARERRVELPGWVPRVTIALSASDRREAEPHLNAVVLRPDEGRVLVVWSARCDVARTYAEEELANMSWRVA